MVPNCAVFFSDIYDFTATANRATSEELLELLGPRLSGKFVRCLFEWPSSIYDPSQDQPMRGNPVRPFAPPRSDIPVRPKGFVGMGLGTESCGSHKGGGAIYRVPFYPIRMNTTSITQTNICDIWDCLHPVWNPQPRSPQNLAIRPESITDRRPSSVLFAAERASRPPATYF